MLGDEAQVVDALCAALGVDGWQVTREVRSTRTARWSCMAPPP